MGGKEEEGVEKEGEGWRVSLEVFGLVRPGGGPEEEAMPGAKAQQAGGGCMCVYREEKSQEDVRERERTHSWREG